MKRLVPALSWAIGALLLASSSPTRSAPPDRTLARADLLDKIRGGWAGQMIGVSFGAKTEFHARGQIGEWPLPWSPEMLSNALDQDDLYVEMTFARVMDTVGLRATSRDYGEAFRTSQYSLWHANAAARRALAHGLPGSRSGHPSVNIHANDIDFQIEADFIGLMCPGLPRESNRLCERVGRVMNYGDGLYGGMFVAGMYAAAFLETDPRRVVEAGLACIPAQSGYARIIADLLAWSAAEPRDWRAVWRRIEEKWNRNDPCPEGALAPFNIDARLNGAYIAFGLLYGGGDFRRTLEISTRCGQDSDCNPSNAAGILGVLLGYDRIPREFTDALAPIADRPFAFTDYSFNQIVTSTERRALQAIQRAGGTIDPTDVRLPRQAPKPPKLEQWDPGIPSRRLTSADPSWSWTGEWTRHDRHHISAKSGNEATLAFKGTGIALLGRLDHSGGRFQVYIDGRKRGIGDAFMPPRTHDNSLWHLFGLQPGRHTLRLVTLPPSPQRPAATEIAIEGAVLYETEQTLTR